MASTSQPSSIIMFPLVSLVNGRSPESQHTLSTIPHINTGMKFCSHSVLSQSVGVRFFHLL